MHIYLYIMNIEHCTVKYVIIQYVTVMLSLRKHIVLSVEVCKLLDEEQHFLICRAITDICHLDTVKLSLLITTNLTCKTWKSCSFLS